MNWFTLPGVLVSISWRIKSVLTADMPQIAASTARLPMTRSCGVVCAAATPARQQRASATNNDFLIVILPSIRSGLLWLERENLFPILFHVDEGPAFRLGLVQRLVELSDFRLSIVGVFAL